MKFPSWPGRFISRTSSSVRRAASRAIGILLSAIKALVAPIGFREVLLLGGSAMLGYGASFVYPPAAFIAPGAVLVGVAIFGVRA